ncbi:alanine racemase [Hansschlegelia zhihuaiae]|uniref:Alanine racemase n=1 Tax=Hansschlegelia zhihuaiae TaxID=405005 RepID=A0A4Q0MP17_9HYPH|nr:alanine racemase [Hansschlegelia zhihuaiae]RXF74786.1 alanine racemase [Hansschlegelia zhihuaiae]
MSEAFPGARLTIDLGALADNWRTLAALSATSECAAVVKADAYGTGLEHAVRALAGAGAKTFFVAHLSEARVARRVAPTAAVYILNGLPPGAAAAYAQTGARPVLGSREEIEEWAAFVASAGEGFPAAIHVDTGMNRLGLRPEEARAMFAGGGPGFRPSLLMSHLACADEPERPETERQRALFAELRALCPETPASLANSAGTLLGRTEGGDLGFDLRRPGVALYGSNPIAGRPSPLKPVVQLEARIVQVRDAAEGEAVGYGGAQRLKRPSRIAVLSLGYADGVMRAGGSEDVSPGAVGFLGETPCPYVGRISMDLIAIDVTDAPDGAARRGAWVEILGDHVSVDQLARACNTIGYEVLTALGRRYERHYVG